MTFRDAWRLGRQLAQEGVLPSAALRAIRRLPKRFQEAAREGYDQEWLKN